MEVIFFNSRSKKFSDSLGDLRDRVFKSLMLLKKDGYLLSMPNSRPLGGGLFELRIVGAVQIRFFYAFHNGNAYILHGFIKKTQKIPRQDIEYARKEFRTLLH